MKQVDFIHLYVQVHVDIRKVYSIRIRKGNDPHRKPLTVKVRAVRGHWRNQRKRRVDGGHDLGIMW